MKFETTCEGKKNQSIYNLLKYIIYIKWQDKINQSFYSKHLFFTEQ